MITSSVFVFVPVLVSEQTAPIRGMRIRTGNAGVILQSLLLHQASNDNRLAVPDLHRRIRLPNAKEGKS